MKRILLFTILLTLTSQVSAQVINGPAGMRCGGSAIYSFNTLSNIRCSNLVWTITFPNGVTSSSSGQSIVVLAGNGPGTLRISVIDHMCRDQFNPAWRGTQAAALTVNVGDGRLERPAAINGPLFMCPGNSATYTATEVPGAGSYTFTVPSGWRINNSPVTSLTTTSRSISVTSPSGSGTGRIAVKANPGSSCSLQSEEKSRSIQYGGAILEITNYNEIMKPNYFGEFFISNSVGLTDIQWTVPGNWTVLSALTSETLRIRTNNSVGTFKIDVTAKTCGVPVSVSTYVRVSENFPGFGGPGGLQRVAIEDPFNLGGKDIVLAGKLSLYPNPVSTKLNIRSALDVDLGKVTVVDLLSGRHVLQKQMTDGTDIDLSHVENGIYLVQISTIEGKQIQKRIVVAH